MHYHYTEWEDYQHGLYTTGKNMQNIDLVKSLLCTSEDFYKAAINMLYAWPKCSLENLTNKEHNRKAWLGQATGCFVYSVSEDVTREAWGNMTDIEHIEANNVAQRIITYFEHFYLHNPNKSGQTVFEF